MWRKKLLVAADESLRTVAALFIAELLGRSLHEVGRRRDQWTADTAVEGELDAAHRVDDHTGGVGGIPYFQLGFQVQRYIAEGGAFHADVAPLAVSQPGHVIAGTDVHVFRRQRIGQHGGDGAGLGNLLGFQAVAFEHVHEIGVAAKVELVGVVQFNAAVNEQAGQHAVQDGGAHLALDVVADDGQILLDEAFRSSIPSWR